VDDEVFRVLLVSGSGRDGSTNTAARRTAAVLIRTPEYAGALPAAMKNLLEWTIGDAGTYEKPIAWINAAGPAAPSGAADAHASLRKVLSDGLISSEPARTEIAALARLADRVRAADTSPRTISGQAPMV
jgi:hypothetical protein